MVSLRNVLAFGLVAAGLWGGCVVSTEEGEGPQGPQYTYPSEGDFCRAVATAECTDSVIQACYGAVSDSNKKSCVDARSQGGRCNPNALAYHPAVADPCVAAHGTVYGDAVLTRDELKSLDEACLPVFNRGYAAGSTCAEDLDCDTSSNLRCIVKPGADDGICAVPAEVGGGEKCGLAEQVCKEDFYCSEQNYCVVAGGVNDLCSSAQPCGSESNCIEDEQDPDTSHCVAKLSDGMSCGADTDCLSGFCVATKCRSTYQLTNSERCDDFLP